MGIGEGNRGGYDNGFERVWGFWAAVAEFCVVGTSGGCRSVFGTFIRGRVSLAALHSPSHRLTKTLDAETSARYTQNALPSCPKISNWLAEFVARGEA